MLEIHDVSLGADQPLDENGLVNEQANKKDQVTYLKLTPEMNNTKKGCC